MTNGFAVWFTGLSGAGKSTIATLVRRRLVLRAGERREVVHLDGDIWRAALGSDLGFSDEDRTENIRRLSYVSAYLANTGRIVLASFIMPFTKSRKAAMELHTTFVLVHADCPISECIRRDTKGLYAKAAAGEIDNMTGMGSPYQTPHPEEALVRCPTAEETPQQSADRVLAALALKGLM